MLSKGRQEKRISLSFVQSNDIFELNANEVIIPYWTTSGQSEIFATCAGNWSRTITSGQTVYNNSAYNNNWIEIIEKQ